MWDDITRWHTCEKKVLIVLFGPVSVEELVCVDDAPYACFAGYGRNINILNAYGFRFDGKYI